MVLKIFFGYVFINGKPKRKEKANITNSFKIAFPFIDLIVSQMLAFKIEMLWGRMTKVNWIEKGLAKIVI